MNTIVLLQKNLAIFKELLPAEQKLLEQTQWANILILSGKGTWIPNNRQSLSSLERYRLTPDYKEDVGVEKCEIKIQKEYGYFYIDVKPEGLNVGGQRPLEDCMGQPDFIGYLEENGMLWGRHYKNKKTGCIYYEILASQIDEYEVLTPTHCLFSNKPEI